MAAKKCGWFSAFAAVSAFTAFLVAFDASKYILLLGLTFVDSILAAILKENVEKRQNLEMLVLPSLQESVTISIKTHGEKKVPFFVANLYNDEIISM